MADHTHIEWTDATWNPITGCSVVSAGCKHCYAMKLAGTRLQHHPSRAGLTIDTKAGPVWTGEVRFNPEWLDQPLRWLRPRRIFVCAHGDLFHEAVPFDWIDRVFAVMALSPQHTFQVLTKRPERMREYLEDVVVRNGIGGADFPEDTPIPKFTAFPLANVWLGVSVEDQAAADERIPLLLQCPAAVRWISVEPLLGAVELGRYFWDITLDPRGLVPCAVHQANERGLLHWIVAGGESGTGARPMHPDWARSLRDQCVAAGVPFLFKQWGGWIETDAVPGGDLGGDMRRDQVRIVKGQGERDGHFERGDVLMRMVSKKAAGRLLDGVQHDGYPAVLP